MVCLTKRATPRIATDNKPSWTSATLHVSRRQFIRRKTTFPVPVLADLVNKDTCLTDFFFFFQIRSWRLDGMTARKHYTHHYCNWTTHKCSLPQKKDRKRKKKILQCSFSFTLVPELQGGFWYFDRHYICKAVRIRNSYLWYWHHVRYVLFFF